jgi:hypothetical protein
MKRITVLLADDNGVFGAGPSSKEKPKTNWETACKSLEKGQSQQKGPHWSWARIPVDMAGPNISGPQPNVLITPDPVSQFNRYDTYLAIDPRNAAHMVGVCRRFFGPGVNYQDTLEVQYTSDFGFTWTTTALPLGDIAFSISDPWIGITSNGYVYIIALAVANGSETPPAAVCCYKSWDGGQTWSDPVLITPFVTGIDNTFGAIDHRSDTVYAIWNDGDGYLGFAYSHEGAAWYASPIAQAQNTRFALPIQGFDYVNIAVAPDNGWIHIIGMNASSPLDLSYARSNDEGVSFQFGAIATNQQGVGDIQELFATASVTSPNLAVVNPPTIFAAGNGYVFAAWSVDTGKTTSNPGPIMRICVACCQDNGEGWSNYQSPYPVGPSSSGSPAPVVVPFLPLGNLSDTPQDQYFMPRLAGTHNGLVGCAFLCCHLLNNGQLIPAQLSTCLSASLPTSNDPAYFTGSTTTTVVVSDQATNPVATNPVLRWGYSNAYFIGDFIGLVAYQIDRPGLGDAPIELGFFPYWSDTRNGTAQIMTCQMGVVLGFSG